MTEDDEDKLAEVIVLFPPLRDPIEEGGGGASVTYFAGCTHPHVIVYSDDTERVQCSKCKEFVTAFSALLKLARREHNFVSLDVALRREQDALHADVERLRRERSSLRSQVKKIRVSRGMPQAKCPTCGRAHESDVGDAPCWACKNGR